MQTMRTSTMVIFASLVGILLIHYLRSTGDEGPVRTKLQESNHRQAPGEMKLSQALDTEDEVTEINSDWSRNYTENSELDSKDSHGSTTSPSSDITRESTTNKVNVTEPTSNEQLIKHLDSVGEENEQLAEHEDSVGEENEQSTENLDSVGEETQSNQIPDDRNINEYHINIETNNLVSPGISINAEENAPYEKKKRTMLDMLDHTLLQLRMPNHFEIEKQNDHVFGLDELHADNVNNVKVQSDKNVNIDQQNKLPQSILGPMLTDFKRGQTENKDISALTFNRITNELGLIRSETSGIMDSHMLEESGDVKQQIQMFDPITRDESAERNAMQEVPDDNANIMSAFVHPDLDATNAVHSANEGSITPENQGIVRGSMQKQVTEHTSGELTRGDNTEHTYDGDNTELTYDGDNTEPTHDGDNTEHTHDGDNTELTYGDNTERTHDGDNTERTHDGDNTEPTLDGDNTELTNGDNNQVQMIIRQYSNTLNETNFPNHVETYRERLRKKLVQTGRFYLMQNETCEKKLPQCIIIGVMKAGTEAFATFLGSNPQVAMQFGFSAMVFFSGPQYENGYEWYRERMMCSTKDQVTMEKSPQYFSSPLAAQRIYQMNPDMKLIVLVRDPIARALSHFLQQQNTHPERLVSQTFEDCTYDNKTNTVRGSSPYVVQSTYSVILKQWMKYFPRQQILIVDGDSFKTRPMRSLRKAEYFLNIDHLDMKDKLYFNEDKGFYCIKIQSTNQEELDMSCFGSEKGRPHPNIKPKVLRALKKYFEPYNKELTSITGMTFTW